VKRWAVCLFRGLILFLIAVIIANIIFMFRIDNEIERILIEDQNQLCFSKEFSVEERIEYSFKNLLIADGIYEKALLERNEKKKIPLLKSSLRFCKQSHNFYPYSHFQYVLSSKIYSELGNDKEYRENKKILKKISDEYFVKKSKGIKF